MFALTLDSAKRIAVIVAIVFFVLALLSAWLIRAVTTKVLTVLILVGLALGVWTQRSSLEDCANRLRAAPGSAATCSFFGNDVDVPGVK